MKWKEAKKNVRVLLSDMKPNPKNPRGELRQRGRGDDEMNQLKDSLKSMGQLNCCIIDSDGIIQSGHRRHFAAQELGWDTLRCDILQPNMTEFQKSAVMISSNSTHRRFSWWEARERIAKIYWDEFLEDYKPTSNKDKGYSQFAKALGLSPSYVIRIVESTTRKNKSLVESLKKNNVGSEVVEFILTSPEHLRSHLRNEAIKRSKRTKYLGKGKLREYMRGVKRKCILEESENISKPTFKFWIAELEKIGFELGTHILDKAEEEDLKELKESIEKNIIGFYNKLVKKLKD